MRRHLPLLAASSALALAACTGDADLPAPAPAALTRSPVDAYTRVLLTAANAGSSNGEGDNFGAAVAFGDFDRDGFQDLAVAAPDDEVGTVRAGQVFIFRGAAGGGLTYSQTLNQGS